jgi:hypothetical protein
LLASPFKHKSSDGSPYISSASLFEGGGYQVPYKSSDDESNDYGESPKSSNLDQEKVFFHGNELSNSYNENPASSDLDPDLEMEEALGNYQDEGELEGMNILAMGQAVEQDDDKYTKSGIVTW